MIDFLASPAFWTSLAALTFLEVVLGIDNLLFVSIAVAKLKGEQQVRARRIGIWGAMILRIVMLAGIFVIIGASGIALFHLPEWLANAFVGDDPEHVEEFVAFTVKDLVLFAGGLFLLVKGTQEIHASVEGTHHEQAAAKADFRAVVIQLFVINLVFSIDSVLTAVGLVDIEGAPVEAITTAVAAVVISTIVMAVAAKPLAEFIEQHPTTKILALAFILLVGVALVADALGFHIPRGYLYFAIAFSVAVELLNIRARRKAEAGKPKAVPH
ncbi:MAG: TerC family protein [Hyphomonadaceae bacterium]|nr:TerC family protein [Hyphomonadaceae bacterium]